MEYGAAGGLAESDGAAVKTLLTYKAEIVDKGAKSLLASGCAVDLELDALTALIRSALSAWFNRFDKDPSSSTKSELEIFVSIETVRRQSDRKEGGS